ncbi:CDP-diacylglycerol--glycerol-3-phosphate 3-phosphatidyltransferase, partial [Psychrobacter proteolyticus]
MTDSTPLPTQEDPPSSQNTKSIFNLPYNLTIARILMITLFVSIAYWPTAMGIGMPSISDNVIAR